MGNAIQGSRMKSAEVSNATTCEYWHRKEWNKYDTLKQKIFIISPMVSL